MAIKTYAQQLEEVQAAITKIESGAQSYALDTGGNQRQVTRGDLETLYKREKQLRALVAREARGGASKWNAVPE